MQFILSSTELDPLPSRRKRILRRTCYGILNTSYKRMAREQYDNINDDHIFSVRNRIKSENYKAVKPLIGGLIKIAIFLTIIAFAI